MPLGNHFALGRRMQLRNEIIDARSKKDSARENKARAELDEINKKIQQNKKKKK